MPQLAQLLDTPGSLPRRAATKLVDRLVSFFGVVALRISRERCFLREGQEALPAPFIVNCGGTIITRAENGRPFACTYIELREVSVFPVPHLHSLPCSRAVNEIITCRPAHQEASMIEDAIPPE